MAPKCRAEPGHTHTHWSDDTSQLVGNRLGILQEKQEDLAEGCVASLTSTGALATQTRTDRTDAGYVPAFYDNKQINHAVDGFLHCVFIFVMDLYFQCISHFV